MRSRPVDAGRLVENLALFGRQLRDAGVRVDAEQIALSVQAALLVGLADRDDLAAALEAVLVSRVQDSAVFRALFDAIFVAAGPAPGSKPAEDPPPDSGPHPERATDQPATLWTKAAPAVHGSASDRPELAATLTASRLQRLRHADFQSLTPDEYRLVERLARRIALDLPAIAGRRQSAGRRGADLHWPGVLRHAMRSAGEAFELPLLRRREQALPLLLLVDISGSMTVYSRLLLGFLHAATRGHRRRDVFVFSTRLTDLTACFRHPDTDAMLRHASAAIPDFAGGTRLGEALATLRRQHARRLVGGRTLVMLVSDGLDTGNPAELGQELAWLKRHCRRLLWLNPLLRFDAYAPLARGAAQLHHFSDAMLAVHDLSRLESLAGGIAALTSRHRPPTSGESGLPKPARLADTWNRPPRQCQPRPAEQS